MKNLILILGITFTPNYTYTCTSTGRSARDRQNMPYTLFGYEKYCLNCDSFDFMNTMIKEKNHSPSKNHTNHSSDNHSSDNKQQINNYQSTNNKNL
jgi:hypothetical protein